MQNFKDNRVKAFLLFTVLYWIAAFFTINHLSNFAVEQEIKEHQHTLQSDIAISRSKIEANIYEDIYAADALSMVLEYDPNIVTQKWEPLAEQLLRKSSNTRSIGVAPDDIIQYIYPIKGNEAALGLNFRNVPHQYRAVEKARQLQSVYLDGPLKLVQGGNAIIARYPIFTDRPLNQQYWGTVSVVLNFDSILSSSNLSDIQFADVAISRLNLDQQQQIIYGDIQTFENPDILLPIHLPNTQWQLAAKLHGWELPATKQAKNIANLLGLGGAFILFISIYFLFHSYRVAHNASLIDDLTQLPNRRFFYAKLAKRISRNKHEGNFSILNIDVNHFKKINDELGHDAGDDLLRYLAKHLTNATQDNDTVARMGGDEFVILLNSADNPHSVNKVIKRIFETLSENPFHWKSNTLTISLSIGCARYQGQSEDNLLAEADMKMYQEKQRHKDSGSNSDFVI